MTQLEADYVKIGCVHRTTPITLANEQRPSVAF